MLMHLLKNVLRGRKIGVESERIVRAEGGGATQDFGVGDGPSKSI